jgi:hypothetical protein
MLLPISSRQAAKFRYQLAGKRNGPDCAIVVVNEVWVAQRGV